MSIWSPIVAPLTAAAWLAIERASGMQPHFAGLLMFLLVSAVIGGLPYLVFAAIGAWLLQRSSVQKLRTASLYAPLAFALILFLIIAVGSLVANGQYGATQPLFVALAYAACAIALGYAYVGLVHVGVVVLRSAGVIDRTPPTDELS